MSVLICTHLFKTKISSGWTLQEAKSKKLATLTCSFSKLSGSSSLAIQKSKLFLFSHVNLHWIFPSICGEKLMPRTVESWLRSLDCHMCTVQVNASLVVLHILATDDENIQKEKEEKEERWHFHIHHQKHSSYNIGIKTLFVQGDSKFCLDLKGRTCWRGLGPPTWIYNLFIELNSSLMKHIIQQTSPDSSCFSKRVSSTLR